MTMLPAITLAVLLAIAVWVAAPLWKKGQAPAGPSSDERMDDLIEAKHAVYRSILDLEFDRKMDKVSEEDYLIIRGQHEADALKLLAEIDGASWTTDSLEREIAAARDRLRR